MKVSVIIPVYNAAAFLSDAVDSALAQPETAEVLLIEDGSTDASLDICKEKAADPRVHVLTHTGNQNKGVSASRNLGLQHASMPFIAFLDADDTYENHRFQTSREIFELRADADGVHEMTGARFLDPQLRQSYRQVAGGDISGIKRNTSPETLFRTLSKGRSGYIHLNALTLRKSALSAEDVFDPGLVMGEDMDFILRLAARHTLYQGSLEKIVAWRGIHGTNSIFTNTSSRYYRHRYLQKCVAQRFYGSTDLTGALYIVSRTVGATKWFAPFKSLGRFALPVKLLGVAAYLVAHPRTAKDLIGML